jgi:hypothetical protein
MRSIRPAACAAALAVLCLAVAAHARSSAPIPVGFYGAPEPLVLASRSAAVNVTVVSGGARAKDVGLSCTSATVPGAAIVVMVPGGLKITGRSFSYSGTVTLTPAQTRSGVSASSTVSIKGRFAAGKIKLGTGIALSGTVSASACASTTPATFALVWNTKSTAG